MSKRKQYGGILAVLFVIAVAIGAVGATRENGIIMVVSVAILGLGAAILNAKYRLDIYREIGEKSPGSYERILTEGEEPAEGRPPYPPEIRALLRKQRQFQLLSTWLPIGEIAIVCVFGILLRNL